MKPVKLLAALICLLFIISCNHAKQENADTTELKNLVHESPGKQEMGSNEDEDFFQDTSVKSTPGLRRSEKPVVKTDWDKKIIKTASLDLEVKEFKKYYSFLREKVSASGGYIAQEEQSENEYRIANAVTIKVPVDQFDELVFLLSDTAEKMNVKKIMSQDVTGEIFDTKVRVEAKKQVRLKYMDLLKQSKNMEETLQVQREINAVQEEIEAASGRIGNLVHSAVFSTISLNYYQVLNATAKQNQSPGFFTRLLDAFRSGWSWVGQLLVGLVTVWPLYLLIGLVIILIKKLGPAKQEKP